MHTKKPKEQRTKQTEKARQTAIGKWTDSEMARLCCSQPSEHWTGAPTT